MQTLKEYIESEIIPRYDNFDGAHRRDHVRSVIRQSQELSRYYDVNPEILYAAAAYHDLGLCEGREKHHLVSGLHGYRRAGRLRGTSRAHAL